MPILADDLIIILFFIIITLCTVNFKLLPTFKSLGKANRDAVKKASSISYN